MSEKEIHILVVDDEDTITDLLKEKLSNLGYKVTTASSGEKAVELAMDEEFDLFLVDLMMPGLNGYQVCEKIRGYWRTEETPIIVVSGKNDWAKDIKEAFDAGANDYIIKGEALDELPEKIKRCLLQTRSNDQ